jgi:PAS domain S-box-containing protein
MRHTGIDAIGDVPWGTHFCQFYETSQDLIETLVPYFKEGLAANESCIWVTSEPLHAHQAKAALKKAVPDLEKHIQKGQIEIIDYNKWRTRSGKFSTDEVLQGWVDTLETVLDKGYDGLRLTGDTFLLEPADWENFRRYQEPVNHVINRHKMLVLCTYSLRKCSPTEIIDVVTNHEFALIKRAGRWEIIESSRHRQTEEETRQLASFPMLNPQPIVEVDTEGHVCFVNPAAQRLFPDLERFGTDHPWLAGWTLAAEAGTLPEGERTPREVRIGDHWYHQTMFVVPQTRRLRIYGTEISRRQQAEEQPRQQAEELRRLNRTLTALGHSSQALMRAKDEKEFLGEACQIIVQDCGHAMVWIGYAEDDEDKSVRPVAHAGFEQGYLETLKITWADTERGRGPTGTAIRTGKPCACTNMLSDPKFVPWREQAVTRGYASSLVLPMHINGRTFGAINIYFRQPAAVSEDEMQLLTELANDVSNGISSIRLREAHARAEEALLKRTQELEQLTEKLEQRVAERTSELAEANELLQAEVTYSHFMEDELRQQREALQTVIDNIPVMLCFYDSEGKAKLTNREFERLLGWSKEEAENLDIAPARTHETAAGLKIQVSADQGIPGWEEYILKTRSGDDLDSSWAGVQLSDGGRIGIGIDMRERKAAEEERLRLAAAVEQSKEGTAITDSRGLIGYANPAFEETSGVARAELVGRCYYDMLIGEEADEGPGKDVRKIVERGEAWSGHVIRKKKNGQSSELDIRLTPIRDESRRVINYLVVERDVTQEVRLQEHLRHVQKMEALGTLAGGIAHDFNNILNPILINTELILMDATLDEETRRDLEITLKAAERGRDLIKQIITFSRQKEKERKPSKVGPVIKEAVRFLRASMGATIDIRQNIEHETGFILVDPTQIHQVVMNLGNNAAYAMRERGGVLEVSLAEVEVDSDIAMLHPDLKPGPHLRLTVSDTGTGMTRDVVERAFDPFFTTKKPREGSGMGLAVVHGIVSDYNGAITVYSEIGKGTTFNIFFRRVPAEGVQAEAAVDSLPKGVGRILLVDDEDVQVQSIRNMLKRLGYHVVARTDPEEALKVFRKDPAHFDLLITDQIMPRLTGARLAEEILRTRPDLPIILCTGFSEKVDANGAHAMGIGEFLMKPFTIREMAAAINRALKKG